MATTPAAIWTGSLGGSNPVDIVGQSSVLSPALARETALFKTTGMRSQAYWDASWDFFAGDPALIPPAIRTQGYDMNRRAPGAVDPLVLAAKVADHALTLHNFASVRAPTLLVWGERDPLLTRRPPRCSRAPW